MDYELLQFIEQSGGISPYWLPKTAPAGMIKFPKAQTGGLDKTDKILLAIGVVALIVALGIIIYRYDKKLFEEKINKIKEKKSKQVEPK